MIDKDRDAAECTIVYDLKRKDVRSVSYKTYAGEIVEVPPDTLFKEKITVEETDCITLVTVKGSPCYVLVKIGGRWVPIPVPCPNS